MRLLHRLLGLLVVAALLAGGIVCLVAALPGDWWHHALDIAGTGEGRLHATWVGVGLLCLAVLFALTGLQSRRRQHFLSYDEEGGTVSISSDAIVDYIAKLSSEFPSIVRMKPSVIPARNSIDIHVELRVKAGPQIHEICELLQRRVRESMTNGLGISEIRRVEVTVAEIVSEHRPS